MNIEILNSVYIKRFSAWAPGVAVGNEWKEWAQGKREILKTSTSPEIAFTDAMFRRRLSQISKMTIQTVHDLLPVEQNTKMMFLSFQGELAKQFTVNKMVIQDNSIMPAAFSLSVFNAPIALASMALGLKGGYSAIYPGTFSAGLVTACASLTADSDINDEMIFVYADEKIPQEYLQICPEDPAPLSFGLLLTLKPESNVAVSSIVDNTGTPESILKNLILYGKENASS